MTTQYGGRQNSPRNILAPQELGPTLVYSGGDRFPDLIDNSIFISHRETIVESSPPFPHSSFTEVTDSEVKLLLLVGILMYRWN